MSASFVATGFVGNDDASVLKGTAIYDFGGYDKNNCQAGQQYTVSVSGLLADNYNIKYQAATFTLTKAYVSALIDGQTYYYKSMPVLDKSGTYKLLANTSYQTIVIGSEQANNLRIVFDLNNYTLTCSGQDIENSIYVHENSNGNTIKIQNGTINGQDTQNTIFINGNNSLELDSGVSIQSNKTAVKLIGENAQLVSQAYIAGGEFAIYEQNAKLNITNGNYDGVLYLNGGEVSISYGRFFNNLVVENLEQFITGGSFSNEVLQDWVSAHCKINNYGNYEVTALPELENFELAKEYYIIGIDQSIDNLQIKLYYEDQTEDIKTVAELKKILNVEFDGDINTLGTHELTFTYDNLLYPDITKQIQIESIEVVDIQSIYDYVPEKTKIGEFKVKVSFNNSFEYEILLEDCVSIEQIDDFEQNTLTGYYEFDAKYGTYVGKLSVYVDKINVVDIKMSNPIQYYQNKDAMIDVTFNNNEEEQLSLYDAHIVVVEIIDDQNNNYASFDDINEPGVYHITVKYSLYQEYDEVNNEYIDYYSNDIQFELTLVGDDAVNSFGVESYDVMLGETPTFWYSTYGGDWYNGNSDIFFELNYIEGYIDVNVVGRQKATVEYNGIVEEITITVHNPEDAKYLSLNGRYLIGGKSTLNLSGEYWNGESINVDFDLDWIIGGTYNLEQKGQYQIVAEYAGLRQVYYLNVVDGADANYFYLSNSEIAINSTEKILFVGYNNLDQRIEFELKPEMITSGEYPNLSKVGSYGFQVTYLGYSSYFTLTVYDPFDTTVTSIDWISENNIVWTYAEDNGNIEINPNYDGLYIRVYRANKTNSVIKVTSDMISFDVEEAKQNAKSDEPFPTISFTLTYEGVNKYGSAVLLTQDGLNQIAEICEDIKITKNGEQISYSSSDPEKVAVELGKNIADYYLKYTYQGYSYYLEITDKDVINSQNQIQDISQAGAYEVSVNGHNFVLIVYDIDDADVWAHFSGNSIQLVEGSSVQNLKDSIIGKQVSINFSFKYIAESQIEYSYSFYEYFNLAENDLGDLQSLDMTEVGDLHIPFDYNGKQYTISATIIPNVQGQVEKTYIMNMYGEVEVKMYDKYIKVYNSWYEYKIIDEENHIFSLKTFMIDELYIIVEAEHKINKFMPSELFVDETAKVFHVLLNEDLTEFRVYQDKYAEIYTYQEKDDGFKHQQTILCQIEVVDGKTYVTCDYGKYISDDDGNLTLAIVGDLVYEYESVIDGQQMRAEFREFNGQKTMYYFKYQEDEYVPVGSFSWEINQEETLIDCYYGDIKLVSFVVENGKIVDMLQNN